MQVRGCITHMCYYTLPRFVASANAPVLAVAFGLSALAATTTWHVYCKKRARKQGKKKTRKKTKGGQEWQRSRSATNSNKNYCMCVRWGSVLLELYEGQTVALYVQSMWLEFPGARQRCQG